jgi:hypothetical protein
VTPSELPARVSISAVAFAVDGERGTTGSSATERGGAGADSAQAIGKTNIIRARRDLVIVIHVYHDECASDAPPLASCTSVARACTKPCRDDRDCAAVGPRFKCFADCDGANTCGQTP